MPFRSRKLHLLFLSFFCFGQGLRITNFSVPPYLLLGSPTRLNCSLDLESDELDFVKWYKDNVEFYRYLTQENPPGKKYHLRGVYLDLSRSTVDSVYLWKTDLASEGMYRCEASAGLPTFQTVIAEKSLQIYALPGDNPSIIGGQSQYIVGDLINVTCRSGPSKPEPKLNWYINGKEAPAGFVRPYPVTEYQPGLWTSSTGLSFVVQSAHAAEGDLELRCTSTVTLSYWDDSREIVFSDNPLTDQIDTEATDVLSDDAPIVTGGRLGDNINFNCSTPEHSGEDVELKWFVNDKEVSGVHLVRYTSKNILGVRMRFGPHYQDLNGDMSLRCRAIKHRLLSLRSSEMTMTPGNHPNSGLAITEDDAMKESERTNSSSGESNTLPDWSFLYLLQMLSVLL